MVLIVFGRASAGHSLPFPVISIRFAKGNILPAKPHRKYQKREHRKLIGQSRLRDLIAFKVYPFTPGENQKARFYPPSHAENTQVVLVVFVCFGGFGCFW